MLKSFVSLLILCACLATAFVYNPCPTCPYQNSPCGYNLPCNGGVSGGGYPIPWCSQSTCYNNYCQYLPCYYNANKNYPFRLNNIGNVNKQNMYNYPFIQFTNNGNKFSNKPNNDPFANAELEIIDHNSTPPSSGQIQQQQQQQYPNYHQFFHNMMNFNQDPFANIPVEIIDEDKLEENGIDPKMVTSSYSTHSVNGDGQQSIVTEQKITPISAKLTRTFTPQENVKYVENFTDSKTISETTTTTTTTTTEENDEPEPINSWFK